MDVKGRRAEFLLDWEMDFEPSYGQNYQPGWNQQQQNPQTWQNQMPPQQYNQQPNPNFQPPAAQNNIPSYATPETGGPPPPSYADGPSRGMDNRKRRRGEGAGYVGAAVMGESMNDPSFVNATCCLIFPCFCPLLCLLLCCMGGGKSRRNPSGISPMRFAMYSSGPRINPDTCEPSFGALDCDNTCCSGTYCDCLDNPCGALDCNSLGCDCDGMSCNDLNCIGMDCNGLDCNGMDCNGMDCNC